jgi:hypothetical protein
MKVLIGKEANLKDSKKKDSRVIRTLNIGETVDLINNNLFGWIEVADTKNNRGFLSEYTTIYQLDTKYILEEKKTDVLKEPNNNAEVAFQMEFGKNFYITEVISKDNDAWLKINIFYGESGYIPANTKFQLMSVYEMVGKSGNLADKWIGLGALGGIMMVILSVIWLGFKYVYFKRISFYALLLFLVGIIRLLTGIKQGNLWGNKKQ